MKKFQKYSAYNNVKRWCLTKRLSRQAKNNKKPAVTECFLNSFCPCHWHFLKYFLFPHSTFLIPHSHLFLMSFWKRSCFFYFFVVQTDTALCIKISLRWEGSLITPPISNNRNLLIMIFFLRWIIMNEPLICHELIFE